MHCHPLCRRPILLQNPWQWMGENRLRSMTADCQGFCRDDWGRYGVQPLQICSILLTLLIYRRRRVRRLVYRFTSPLFPALPFFRITFSAPSLAALPNVSYAFMMSFIAKRCVTSLCGCNSPDCTIFSSMGVVIVSTSRVVSEILRSQSFSDRKS